MTCSKELPLHSDSKAWSIGKDLAEELLPYFAFAPISQVKLPPWDSRGASCRVNCSAERRAYLQRANFHCRKMGH